MTPLLFPETSRVPRAPHVEPTAPLSAPPTVKRRPPSSGLSQRGSGLVQPVSCWTRRASRTSIHALKHIRPTGRSVSVVRVVSECKCNSLMHCAGKQHPLAEHTRDARRSRRHVWGRRVDVAPIDLHRDVVPIDVFSSRDATRDASSGEQASAPGCITMSGIDWCSIYASRTRIVSK